MITPEEFKKIAQQLITPLCAVFLFSILLGAIYCVYLIYPDTFNSKNSSKTVHTTVPTIDDDRIENGIHVRTGLIDDDGLMTVVNNCTNCHSAKLVTQNRMSAERWNATIKWMQETQGLWNLGSNQDIIVNYLVKNYPLKHIGRRENLKNIDWYELEN